MKRYVWSALLTGAIVGAAWADDDDPPIFPDGEYVATAPGDGYVAGTSDGYVSGTSEPDYYSNTSGHYSSASDHGYAQAPFDYGHMNVKYPVPPGAGCSPYGDPPLRPVYQQPLTPPVQGCMWGCGWLDALFGCDSCGGSIGCGCGCGDCGSGDCGCEECVQPLDIWVRMEYLSWWAEGTRLPPLVTTASGTGSGIVNDPETVILFGATRVDEDARSGGRFTFGAWLDDQYCDAFEVNFFWLGDSSTNFDVQSGGTPLIARPFFNVELQTNGVQTIAAQGISTGGVFITTASQVDGAEILLRRRIDNCCTRRVDWIYGYRYARLDENLTIRDELTSVDPLSNIPAGTVVGGFDSFDTRNQFHGGEIGLAIDFYRSRWTWGLVTKLAFGNMHEEVAIAGNTIVTVPGEAPSETVGGLLTQPSNIGIFERDEFAVIPEFQLNLRYCLRPRLELSVGYTLMYFSDVVRPGDQVDLRVDPRQITDPANATPFPAFTFVDGDFLLQGINAGLEFRF